MLARGGTYDVQLDDGSVVEATLRGRLKLERRTGDRVVAGDRVHVLGSVDDGSTIEAVDQRTSEIARRAPGRGDRRAKIIVANIDQIAIVFAVARPHPNLHLLDRFLVLAESNDLPALVIANKIDLMEADAQSVFGIYVDLGYPVLYTSVEQHRGIEDLRTHLRNRITVFTGPSGVGKSSLLNAMQPGIGLRVAAQDDGRGRHTTVSARLVPLDVGGFVADTPGLRELSLWDVDVDTLVHYFPEFRARQAQCRFGNTCTHTHEPGCAVVSALEAGEIVKSRYESYVSMRTD